MAERSQFWSTGTTGDGTTTISEAQTIEFFRDVIAPYSGSGPSVTQGVLHNVMGRLAVSGVASPISVAAGAALVEGFYYKNDASLNVTVPTPVGATRIDLIVLRADHSARTVRITRIEGTPGAGAPSMTQVAGTTWDVPLAQVTITTGGNITLVDQRFFCHFATMVSGGMLDSDVADGTTLELSGTNVRIKDNGVSNAKLRDSAALSVIGRSANSSGDPADIAASSDGHVLRRSGTSLGFGQVATAGVANDAIDDTKVGNRVPQFIRRQGGNSANWGTAGTSNYTPGMVRMQSGSIQVTHPGGSQSSTVSVTFPVAFSQVPQVFLTTAVSDYYLAHKFFYITATEFSFNMLTVDGASVSSPYTVQWLAVGPE